jgi:hypothetical protein
VEFLFWVIPLTVIYLNIQYLEMFTNLEMRQPKPPHLANLNKNFDREPYQMCVMEWLFFMLTFAAIIYLLYFIVKLFITPPDYRIVTLKQNV